MKTKIFSNRISQLSAKALIFLSRLEGEKILSCSECNKASVKELVEAGLIRANKNKRKIEFELLFEPNQEPQAEVSLPERAICELTPAGLKLFIANQILDISVLSVRQIGELLGYNHSVISRAKKELEVLQLDQSKDSQGGTL